MPVKLLTSGGGGVNLVPSGSIASDQTMYLPTSGTSGGTVLCTDSSGNLGIGTTSPAEKLEVSAATNSRIRITANTDSNADLTFYTNGVMRGIVEGNSVGVTLGTTGALPVVFIANNAEKMRLDSSGNLTITGSTATKASGTTWANPSDQRLKDNIRDYEKGLVELLQVRVREWEYNGKGGTTEGLKGLGVVADEIETILPNTVETYEAKLEETDEEVTTIKKFDATEITWLLVNAVKELTQRIEALEYTKQGE